MSLVAYADQIVCAFKVGYVWAQNAMFNSRHLVDEEADGVEDRPHVALFPSALLHQGYDHSAAPLFILLFIVLLQETDAVLRIRPESICGKQ